MKPIVCNGDMKHQESFSVFCSVTSDDEMKELAGVNKKVFIILLSLITCAVNVKVSKENHLLIFLMKMKLGMHFSALSCILDFIAQR